MLHTLLEALPSSHDRVPEHTAHTVNKRITDTAECHLEYFARRPELIGHRLHELDREWDIERVLETNAATFVMVGSTLALLQDRRWALLPFFVGGFLLQHALQGWCPPLPLLRRRGFRTPEEIAEERTALQALRGDFDGLPARGGRAALRAARRDGEHSTSLTLGAPVGRD